MKNPEENKFNTYYLYYDSITNKLYNVKELINNRDTTYILEKKNIKIIKYNKSNINETFN